MKRIDKITGRWIKERMAMKPPAVTKGWVSKRIKGPKPKTYVVIILDKSSSMASCRENALNYFNEQISEIKKSTKNQDVMVSLVMFDTLVHYRYYNANLSKLTELKLYEYVPSGMTALNDAIGCTIDKMQIDCTDLYEDHVSVLFIIVTDGQENVSKTYPNKLKHLLTAKIEELQSTGRWTFTYMGTEHNVEAFAASYSIPAANVMRFEKKTFSTAIRSSRVATNTYFKSRIVGKKSTEEFYDKKI